MKPLQEMSEAELREFKAICPESIEELNEHINALVERKHEYGTCVYAMSLAAVAAYNYVAHKLGVTGFQASCADLDILKRNRRMEDGFRIIDYNKLLYPQYLTSEHFPTIEQLLEENKEQLKKRATELLSEEDYASDEVKEHWKKFEAL